jgi:phospholipid/cholesterol/gamma-HCH transport system substrate-binding protein
MPAKKHDFSATEIKAGIFVVLSVLVLLGFIAAIRGMRPPEETRTYVALFRNTAGLNLGADVRFGGVKVGRVSQVAPDTDDRSQIRVEATVAPNTPVNTETVATIEQITLTAEKHLELSTGDVEAELLPDGAVVKSVTKSGGLVELPDMEGVITKVEDLLDDLMAFLGVDEAQELEAQGEEEFAKVTRVTADLRETLDEGTALVQDVRNVIEEQRPNITEITGKVKDIQDSVQEVVQEVQGMLEENRGPLKETVANVEASTAQVEQITQDVSGVLDGLEEDIEQLLSSLQGTLDHAGGLSGNARDFLEDNRPVIEDIILELRTTLRYLQDFSRTIAEQPESVIRGKAPAGRVP